jgi:membrane protein implicated in regulation of membrane protease activity
MVGRSARIVEVLPETHNERRLRVEIDGLYWNAIVKGRGKTQLKVGDNVTITDSVGLELIVQ